MYYIHMRFQDLFTNERFSTFITSEFFRSRFPFIYNQFHFLMYYIHMTFQGHFISKTFSTFITNEFILASFRFHLTFICQRCIDIGIKNLAIFVFWHLLGRAKDWIRRNAAFTFPFATNIDACTVSTVCLWSEGIPKKSFQHLKTFFMSTT